MFVYSPSFPTVKSVVKFTSAVPQLTWPGHHILDVIYLFNLPMIPDGSKLPPPPRKRPCGESARHSGSAPFPRGECTGGQSGGREGTAASGRFMSYSESSTLFNGPSPKSDLQSANRTLYITLGTTSKISAFRSFIYKIKPKK